MPSLQIDSLCFGYTGKAMNQPLSLEAHAGEFWAVLGENGVGKSTLLATLADLLRPVSGHVFVDGVSVRRLPRKILARRLGLLLQHVDVSFPYSVRETVGAGRYAHRAPWSALGRRDREIVDWALTQTGLHALAERRADQLSGGEQRRAAIATLLAQQPGVMLLDEPVNHLDVRHEVDLMTHFREYATEGGVVMVSLHDVNLASQYADRLLLLYPDGDWEQGEPETLLTEARLERLYGVPLHAVGSHEYRFWVPLGKPTRR